MASGGEGGLGKRHRTGLGQALGRNGSRQVNSEKSFKIIWIQVKREKKIQKREVPRDMRFKEFGGFKYDFDRFNIRLRFGMEETGTRGWRTECCGGGSGGG